MTITGNFYGIIHPKNEVISVTNIPAISAHTKHVGI